MSLRAWTSSRALSMSPLSNHSWMGPSEPPLRQIRPSAYLLSACLSTRGSPMYSPSRWPREMSLVMFFQPVSFLASRVRRVERSRPGKSFFCDISVGAR